jgi:hypothetical protein
VRGKWPPGARAVSEGREGDGLPARVSLVRAGKVAASWCAGRR